jgi:hypothetical protein
MSSPAQTPEPGLPDKRPPDDDLSWKILGLHVARKTEVLALAAFVISISGLSWQVFNYTRGAVVRLFPSDQIVLTSTDALGHRYAGQVNLLDLIATMSYVNDGDTGHNAIVRRELIRFTLAGRRVEHRWYDFVSSDVVNGKMVPNRLSEARPFAVNAGSAASHETLFTAWEIDCPADDKACDAGVNFVPWDDFLKAIKTSKTIEITTQAEVYSGGTLSASCVIRLRDWEVAFLEKEQWIAVTCSQASAQSQRRSVAPAPFAN